MFQTISLFIGMRYIGSKRRNGFLAFISIFALLGMTLGVFALIVVLSVMNGFDKTLKDRVLKVVPHAYLSAPEGLADWRDLKQSLTPLAPLEAASPYIGGKGLIQFGRGVRGIEIQGVLPETEAQVSVIAEHMVQGSLDNLTPGGYQIVLGNLLARYLGVGVGDKISITLPIVSVTPAGIFPRSKRFTVAAVYEVGAQVDEYLTLIHVQDAQKLFRMGDKVAGLRLKFDSIYTATQYREQTLALAGDTYEFKDWSQTQGSLFQAVKMEKTVVGVLLSIIIAVAAFNIVTSLVMMVAEKRSDIAVLRTMGLSRLGVIKIFMVQGTLLGVIGVAVGAISGIITAHFLTDWIVWLEQNMGIYVFDPSVYFVSHLPSVWRWEDTLWVCSFAVILSFLATIYPAYRASKISPAEALRYDI